MGAAYNLSTLLSAQGVQLLFPRTETVQPSQQCGSGPAADLHRTGQTAAQQSLVRHPVNAIHAVPLILPVMVSAYSPFVLMVDRCM